MTLGDKALALPSFYSVPRCCALALETCTVISGRTRDTPHSWASATASLCVNGAFVAARESPICLCLPRTGTLLRGIGCGGNGEVFTHTCRV